MGGPITNNLLKPPSTTASNATANTTPPTAGTVAATVAPNKQLHGGRIGGVTSPPKAQYIPLHPKNTEFGYGVVHLYRDGEETKGVYPTAEEYISGSGAHCDSARVCSSTSISPARSLESATAESTKLDEDTLKTVAILAVPSYMTTSDFMGFVGEDTKENASHFRMIRTGKANRYMVLIRFRQADKAKEFVRLFNGRVFNSMEVG